MAFPKDFTWGAAAAAYQVEGAARDDGRGPSVWDAFCQRDGAVLRGDTGAVACDHYHRFRDDIAIMKEIGLKAYRLSISWSRVLPDGTGAPNEKGLAFYDQLIDALLAAKIEPWVTLFHWDFPEALFARGGWLSSDSPQWFADYAELITKRLSDRVTHWMTLNEPQCFIELGHFKGNHAPGLKLSWQEVLRAGHSALLAHGRAVQVLRGGAKQKPIIGWAPVGSVKYPASERDADVRAARSAMFATTTRTTWTNTWFSDPVCFGHYPEDALTAFGSDAPKVRAGDMETICQPLDFYGVNIYQGSMVRASATGTTEAPRPIGAPLTAFRWNVTPDALYWGPKFLHERYRLPVVITENGLSSTDWIALDGRVHDASRIDFAHRYLLALKRAIDDGVDVRGYFHWSILDNFEWAQGYQERFGLVYVDYPTQRRIPKDSSQWYRKVIDSNGASLEVAKPAALA
jgi:beta-glucosidase